MYPLEKEYLSLMSAIYANASHNTPSYSRWFVCGMKSPPPGVNSIVSDSWIAKLCEFFYFFYFYFLEGGGWWREQIKQFHFEVWFFLENLLLGLLLWLNRVTSAVQDNKMAKGIWGLGFFSFWLIVSTNTMETWASLRTIWINWNDFDL